LVELDFKDLLLEQALVVYRDLQDLQDEQDPLDPPDLQDPLVLLDIQD
jgi:hypothetical protein